MRSCLKHSLQGGLATLFVAFALAFSVCAPVRAEAGAETRLLVVGDDSSPRSLARGSQIFNRVMAEIKSGVAGRGVSDADFEGVAAKLGWTLRKRMPRSEILQLVAQASQADDPKFHFDVVALFAVFVTRQSGAFADKMAIQVDGELHDVTSDQVIAVVGHPLTTFPVPANCDMLCMTNEVGRHMPEIAEEIGRKVAEAF